MSSRNTRLSIPRDTRNLTRLRLPTLRSLGLGALSLAVLGAHVSAQSETGVAIGDTVRIDGEFVGRITSMQSSVATVLGQGEARCTAPTRHGEAPVCDPPPMVRNTYDLSTVSVERPSTGGKTKRLIIAGVLGGAVGAVVGRSVGPSIGFGQVYECVVVYGRETCSNREFTSPEVQRASDQKRGALYFGVITGTVAVIVANKLSNDWVRVEPVVPVRAEGGWGVALTLPLPNH